MIETYYVQAGKAQVRWARCIGSSETVCAPASGYWLDALDSLKKRAALPSTIAEIDAEIAAQKARLGIN